MHFSSMFVRPVGSGVKASPKRSGLRSWIGLGTKNVERFWFSKIFDPIRIGLRVSGLRDRTNIVLLGHEEYVSLSLRHLPWPDAPSGLAEQNASTRDEC